MNARGGITAVATRSWFAISLLALISLGLRVFKLNVLPPGLSQGEIRLLGAVTGQAASPADVFVSPLFSGLLWLWTKVVGLDVALLRLLPAVLGALAVVATWLWVRSWFGARVAWIAALFMAASPWALTLSRNLSGAALAMTILPLLLWMATIAYREGDLIRRTAAAATVAAALSCGPAGWLAVGITGLCGLIGARSRRAGETMPVSARQRFVAGLGLAVLSSLGLICLLLAPVRRFAGLSLSPLADVPQYGLNLVKGLGMFHVAGDPSYVHNLGGAPLLNIFTGLMLVAGLIYAFGRSRSLRYRRLIIAFGLALIPVVVMTVNGPNAAWAVLVLPPTMAIAALGTGYLLSMWLSTFPANAAARLAGRIAVGILVALSAVQGFTQYFHAWGGSPETYVAYQASAVEAARYAAQPATGTRDIVVATPGEQAAIRLLAANTTVIAPSDVTTSLGAGPLRFIITPAAVDATTVKLQDGFAGAKLTPHNFRTGSQSVYTYEVTR